MFLIITVKRQCRQLFKYLNQKKWGCLLGNDARIRKYNFLEYSENHPIQTRPSEKREFHLTFAYTYEKGINKK